MNIRYPKITLGLSVGLALFMLLSGAMTFLNADSLDQMPDLEPQVRDFYAALVATGYMIYWIGIYKMVNGILMLWPKTRVLAVLGALPYYVNILLYSIWVAPQFLVLGIVSFVVTVYLVWAYQDYWRSVIR